MTRIGTNNRLRRVLKSTVARFDLSNTDPAVRLAAAQEMLRSLDEPGIALLRERIGSETDARVKEEIETGLALAALGDPDRRQPAPCGGDPLEPVASRCPEPALDTAR